MSGHNTMPKLLCRYWGYRCMMSPLQAIDFVITWSSLPKNMKQRMADLLQLELVKRKLL